MRYTFINKDNAEQVVDVPEEFLERTVRSLGCDVREACEIYLSDEGYIVNEVVQELTEKAGGHKMRKSPQRKPNNVKRALIEYMRTCLDGKALATADGMFVCDDVAVTNPERIIEFVIDDDVYTFTLSKKRKTK